MQKYVVGFTIADARNLVTEDGTPCDPFVVVECCNKKFQTQTKENKSQQVAWNENHIWPDIELYPDEFESAYVEFSVYARHWFTRNYLIGKASLQLTNINKRVPGHVYAKKSLYLRQQENTTATGMINITVFCLKPGETAPSESQMNQATVEEPDGEGEKDDDFDVSKLVLGKLEQPNVRPYHVHVNIFRVEDLPKIGFNRFPSPFVTVEFAGVRLKTEDASDVEQYTWNLDARIPVVVPVYEDTILIKLWHRNYLAADELLAQGLISFSELRNNALPPRWFNLYGWDPDEIPDVKQMSKGGEKIEPNYFKGKLLISGRVERIPEGEDMKPAQMINAKLPLEPTNIQQALLADVYEVSGAVGRECQVQLAFGKYSKETNQWVTPSREEKHLKAPTGQTSGDKGDSSWNDREDEQIEAITAFKFDQTQGRIDPLLVMTPEDVDSQPYLFVNVYTRGVLSGRTRIGYHRATINDFQQYEVGNPAKPRFMPLEAMPYNTHQRSPASLLIVIERHSTDDVPRHNRKNVKPMAYILRAYVFMGRAIKTDNVMDYAVRVACAGVSKSTNEINQVRPMWMDALQLKVTLSSDHPKEPPTMEPITVTLCEQKTILGSKSQTDIGKTVCTYQYMRQKDNMDRWEPYHLKPQWIKLMGGSYGGKEVGEVLIAFELLQWRSRDDPELQIKEMWPVMEKDYDEKRHFARLRKATLHFSLYGLRDIIPTSSFSDSEPLVIVQVKKFEKEAQKGKKADRYHTIEFSQRDVIDTGGDSKWDKLQKWRSDALGVKDCWNYELFEVKKMNIMVPDHPLLQPFIAIRVHEKPYSWSKEWFGREGTLIGECRQSLSEWFPCCWFKGVSKNQPFKDQAAKIEAEIRQGREMARAKTKFMETSRDEREIEMKAERQRRREEKEREQINRVVLEEEIADAVDSSGLPRELRPFQEKINPDGYHERERETLTLKPLHKLNMHVVKSFPPREGEAVRQKDDDVTYPVIHGKLEESNDPHVFQQDFWFKNRPLLRNHDMLDDLDTTDYSFDHSGCFGFVKFAFKLTDGWEAEEDSPEYEETAIVDPNADPTKANEAKLCRSYGWPIRVDDMFDEEVFTQKSFQQRYKSKEHVPSRVRVRIYLVQAICIFGKGSSSFADPYLHFRLGKNISVSMRNMAQFNTNTPSFYRVEERDIDMPVDARLQVDLIDYSDVALVSPPFHEKLIGSTVIDLEDRWHSTKWREADKNMKVPHENRPLFNQDLLGQNCGSIEMWIEMIDSVSASERKATEMAVPRPIEIEVRFIMKTTTNIKIPNGTSANVKIEFSLDCEEYEGDRTGYPKRQFTDEHNGCKEGDAEFNYRIVYPRIVMPTKSCTVDITVYDHGHLAGDTYIGSVSIDLRKYVDRVARDMDMIQTDADLRIHASAGMTDGEEVEDENIGQVQFTLQVMTQNEATQKLAGMGRSDPNDFPQLVTPTEGRGWGDVFADIGFSLPDFGIWKKVLPLIIFTLLCLVALRSVGLL